MKAAWCTPRAVEGGRSPRGATRSSHPAARVAKSAAIAADPTARDAPRARRALAGSLRRMSDWNFARVWDSIAAEAPERVAVVCGSDTRTYGELADRAARLAGTFAAHDVGPGAKVAIDLLNRPEYLETFYAALLLGCVPVNVNYRYGPTETGYVVRDSDAKVVVHEPELAATGEAGVRATDASSRPSTLERGAAYEEAIAAAPPDGPWRARAPEGDDLVFLYTGGTTGMPKGVMWRSDDLYVALWQMARPGTEPGDPVAAVRA